MSDPAIDDALYDTASMQLLSGLPLATILTFHHLFEGHILIRKMFLESTTG
ncbi:MAG: hypothetical protein QNK43_13270 [Amphritea sp.]|nr:hypothetical protein [Amphritea sp.]